MVWLEFAMTENFGKGLSYRGGCGEMFGRGNILTRFSLRASPTIDFTVNFFSLSKEVDGR
jgi:hypothetical protein